MNGKLKFVLLIDDDVTTSLLIERMLLSSDNVEEVLCARSGSEALNILRRRSEMGYQLPEIMLLDLKMPQMSGWDFLAIYVNEFKQHTKSQIILLTASSDTKDLIKSAVHPDVDDYINKPIMKAELDRILAQQLTKSALNL